MCASRPSSTTPSGLLFCGIVTHAYTREPSLTLVSQPQSSASPLPGDQMSRASPQLPSPPPISSFLRGTLDAPVQPSHPWPASAPHQDLCLHFYGQPYAPLGVAVAVTSGPGTCLHFFLHQGMSSYLTLCNFLSTHMSNAGLCYICNTILAPGLPWVQDASIHTRHAPVCMGLPHCAV